MKYSDLKGLIARKNLAWQFDDSDAKYVVWARDGADRYESELWKNGESVVGLDVAQNTADLADFEANYKSVSNYAIGQRPYAFATGDFDFYGDGNYAECAAGQATDIDYTFAQELYVNGGTIVLDGSVLGDWIEVHVIHPVYGAIKTYIKKRYVPSSFAGSPSPLMEIKTPYAGKIPAGLKLRMTYHSTGGATVKIGINYDLHKAI